MSVLDRAALEQSPLADLHLIASELGLDGYRRLRKSQLIDTIIERQGGEPSAAAEEDTEPPEPRRRTRQVETAKKTERADEDDAAEETEEAEPALAPDEEEQPSARRRRGRRGGRSRVREEEEETAAVVEEVEEEPVEDEGETIEGVVELLPNGSGFLRLEPPEPSDNDVYISAAQVKRCELISGDRVAGPRRAPRRSERFASLVRIDTINGQPATELASGTRFDDMTAAFPSERFKLGSEDPTVKAIEWLTPFGKGSRVTIIGGPRSGKTEALRRLAHVLAAQDEALHVSVALAGVRPEEISEWTQGPVAPAAATNLAASSEAQGHGVELAIDQARRIAARGGDAVVLIDALDGLTVHAARKALAAARKIVDGGSLTVIATAGEPLGGETTVIALDERLASTGRFPALDLGRSGTMRPELLVGEAGAEAIARARQEALEQQS